MGPLRPRVCPLRRAQKLILHLAEESLQQRIETGQLVFLRSVQQVPLQQAAVLLAFSFEGAVISLAVVALESPQRQQQLLLVLRLSRQQWQPVLFRQPQPAPQ